MREKISIANWEYEINEVKNEYGFKVDIYKNKILTFSQGGFGSIVNARKYAKDVVLYIEFGIERENGNFQ